VKVVKPVSPLPAGVHATAGMSRASIEGTVKQWGERMAGSCQNQRADDHRRRARGGRSGLPARGRLATMTDAA
jgi:hypothetical protein